MGGRALGGAWRPGSGSPRSSSIAAEEALAEDLLDLALESTDGPRRRARPPVMTMIGIDCQAVLLADLLDDLEAVRCGGASGRAGSGRAGRPRAAPSAPRSRRRPRRPPSPARGALGGAGRAPPRRPRRPAAAPRVGRRRACGGSRSAGRGRTAWSRSRRPPGDSPRSFSSSIVAMMIGISIVSASVFSAARTAQPSMPGITMSRMIAEGCSCLASRRPSSPLEAAAGLIALLAEVAPHQLADRGVVVDDQDRGWPVSGLPGPAGRVGAVAAAGGVGAGRRGGRADLGGEPDREGRALAHLALDADLAAHRPAIEQADRQPQADAACILPLEAWTCENRSNSRACCSGSSPCRCRGPGRRSGRRRLVGRLARRARV